MIFENDEISSNLSSRHVAPLYFISDEKQDREYYQRNNTRHQGRSKLKSETIEPARLVFADIDYHKEKCGNDYSDETGHDGSG